MMEELKKLRELTETLTGNGYLKDQAQEWEYALDAIPNYVYIINDNYEIKFANRLLCERLGINKQDIQNRKCYKVVNSESAEDLPEAWRKKFDGKKPLVIEEAYLENLKGWFKMTKSPIYTKTNKLIGSICTLQDITEKKHAVDNLVLREATLETIFNTAPICIGLIQKDTRIIKAVNKNFKQVTGFTSDELVGQSIEMLYANKEEFNRVGVAAYKNIDTIGFGDTETTWVTKQGEARSVYLRTARIENEEDVVFTAVDVTGDKHMEQRMKLFAEQTPLGVIGWDLDYTINSWNEAAETIFGFSREEALGKTANLIIPEDERVITDEVWRQLLTQSTSLKSSNRNITRDGIILYCEWYNNVLMDAKGDAVGVMSLVMDVTSEKLNDERLQSALTLATMNHKNEDAIMDFALEEAVRLTSSKIGYLHFVDDNGSDINLELFKWSKAVHFNCTAVKTPHYPLAEAGCWADSLRNKQAVVHNDYSKLTEADGKKGLPKGHFPLIRHMSIPIIDDGRVVAIAGVGNKNNNYNSSDTRQLSLFMNSMWDIVKRSRAEAAAREREQELLVAMEYSRAGIAIANATDGSLRFVNEAGLSIRGGTYEELVEGVSAKDLAERWNIYRLDGSSYNPDEFPLTRALLNGEVVEEEFLIKRAKNDFRHVLASAAPIFNGDPDEPTAGIVVFMDITDRIRIEEALSQSEQRYRLLAENIEGIIWTIDTKLNFTFISPAVKDTLGYEPEDCIGHNLLEFTSDEDFAYMAKKVGESLLDKDCDGLKFETHMLHKGGHRVAIELTARTLRDSKGSLVGFQGRTRVLE